MIMMTVVTVVVVVVWQILRSDVVVHVFSIETPGHVRRRRIPAALASHALVPLYAGIAAVHPRRRTPKIAPRLLLDRIQASRWKMQVLQHRMLV